jgi:hypothetical protein
VIAILVVDPPTEKKSVGSMMNKNTMMLHKIAPNLLVGTLIILNF